MSDTIITVILSFNIILLVLYFIVRINKRYLDKARDAYQEAVAEQEKRTVTDEEALEISNLLKETKVPEKYRENKVLKLTYKNVDVIMTEKGKIDKNVNELGIILQFNNNKHCLNLFPISFLSSTKKNALYIRNDDKKLLGFYTPFHIILINVETMECTQSIEDDTEAVSIEIPLTSYSIENTAVEHFKTRFYETFHEPLDFVRNYYGKEYKELLAK